MTYHCGRQLVHAAGSMMRSRATAGATSSSARSTRSPPGFRAKINSAPSSRTKRIELLFVVALSRRSCGTSTTRPSGLISTTP